MVYEYWGDGEDWESEPPERWRIWWEVVQIEREKGIIGPDDYPQIPGIPDAKTLDFQQSSPIY